MSYVYSSDPRLKRHASASPDDAPRDPKRPTTFAVREKSPVVTGNHAKLHSSEVVATPAPVMEAARKAQIAPIVDLKMQINLQTITMMNLQLKLENAEAQVRAAEADYQSHANKNHFTAFPALKETKTAAVDRANKAVKVARQPLDSARSDLHRLIESLVDLEQSNQAPVQDAISREELEALEALRRDLTGIKSDIGNIMKDLKNARGIIDSCKADQVTATKTMEDLQRQNDSHARRMDANHSVLPAHVDPGMAQRLDGLESDVEQFESDLAGTSKTIADWVLGELKAPKEAMVELQAGLRNTESTVTKLHEAVQRTDEKAIQLNNALAKGIDDQHTNAKTLQGCLDRLDKLEPILDRAADKEALGAVKTSIQQISDTVESFNTSQQKKMSEPQQKRTNGVSPGLSSFQPIPGGDDRDDMSPFQSRPTIPGTLRKFDDKDLLQMKMEIEGLKYKVQDQTNRYNNLQTDQLAQTILDNLGAVYPNLKEAERVTKTVHELQGRLGAWETNVNDVNARTGAIANHVGMLDSNAVAARHVAEQDRRKLRDDITALSRRVDQHAKDIEGGRLQLQEHTAAISKSKDDLRGVEAWITGIE